MVGLTSRSAGIFACLASVAVAAPPCWEELVDIAVSRDSNETAWNESFRVSQPVWDAGNLMEPSFVALPRTAADVQRCLQCAMKHHVRVAVKGGGHSFGGYSSLPASRGFMLNMRFMAAASPVRPDNTVHVMAGARWRDVYKSFQASGEEWVVNGGLCPSVGIAGFTMGGGAGPAARMYGLGADGVLSYTMVTADGSEVVVANETSNQELFWALRGGGGGNFGVVTDLTVRVHPGPDLYTFGQLCFAWEDMESTLRAIQEMGETLPHSINVDAIAAKGHSGMCLWVIGIETIKKTRARLAPLVAASGKVTKDTLTEWNCYWEGITQFAKEHGYSEYNDEPYLSKNCLIDEITPGLIAALKQVTESAPDACSGGQHFIGFGGKTREVAYDATAFPWRNSTYMVYTSCGYKSGDDKSRQEAIAFLKSWSDTVFPFCNGGSYINFLDPLAGPEGFKRYYGVALPRLQQVKRQWRPKGFNPLRFPLEIPLPEGEALLQV